MSHKEYPLKLNMVFNDENATGLDVVKSLRYSANADSFGRCRNETRFQEFFIANRTFSLFVPFWYIRLFCALVLLFLCRLVIYHFPGKKLTFPNLHNISQSLIIISTFPSTAMSDPRDPGYDCVTLGATRFIISSISTEWVRDPKLQRKLRSKWLSDIIPFLFMITKPWHILNKSIPHAYQTTHYISYTFPMYYLQ